MRSMLKLLPAFALLFALSAPAFAQESQAAQTTRKKLKQKVDIDIKELGTKAFLEEVNRELDSPITFKIDNASGVSNNTKLSYKGKGVPVEKLLNDLSDKYDFGWIVISNAANNRVDGHVVIRKGKGKERGYEAGKEPKEKTSLESAPSDLAPSQPQLIAVVSSETLEADKR
jgi:hypothetical protein